MRDGLFIRLSFRFISNILADQAFNKISSRFDVVMVFMLSNLDPA